MLILRCSKIPPIPSTVNCSLQKIFLASQRSMGFPQTGACISQRLSSTYRLSTSSRVLALLYTSWAAFSGAIPPAHSNPQSSSDRSCPPTTYGLESSQLLPPLPPTFLGQLLFAIEHHSLHSDNNVILYLDYTRLPPSVSLLIHSSS
eukprot:Gb_31416 [translate_table: standard]